MFSCLQHNPMRGWTGVGWVRLFACVVMMALLFLPRVAGVEPTPPPVRVPNILVILADDLGWTDVGTGNPNRGNGSDMYRTPHIDRLAAEGLSFTSAYVHPNCAPTRAALLSGQYAPRAGNGVYNVGSLDRGSGGERLRPPPQAQDVPSHTDTLAEMLSRAGYVTCHVGKYHVGGHEGGEETLPRNQGFTHNFGGTAAGSPVTFFADRAGVFDRRIGPELDAFGAPYGAAYTSAVLTRFANGNDPATLIGTRKHLVDAEADAAVAFLERHRAGASAARPFYLQVHSYAVHTPIQPRPDLAAKYAALAGKRHTHHRYAAHVEGLDQAVGRLLDYLDGNGLSANTLVLFLSDNGGHEGPTDNAPLRARKGSFYDGGIRVPLIARMPGTVPANAVTDTLVHAVDLYPTLMELAGGSTTGRLDGTSFLQHLRDPTAHPRHRNPIFYHFPGYLDDRARPCSLVIRDVDGIRYKLIYSYDEGYDPTPGDDGITAMDSRWELYNLSADIGEATNLLADSAMNRSTYLPIAAKLATDLHAWLTAPDPDWQPAHLRDPSTGESVPFP